MKGVTERQAYIVAQREAGRRFTELAKELQLSPTRIRQIYLAATRAQRLRTMQAKDTP